LRLSRRAVQAAARKKVELAASDIAVPDILEELKRLRLEVQTLKAELATRSSKVEMFCMNMDNSHLEEQSALRSTGTAHRVDGASQSSHATDTVPPAPSREKIVGQASHPEVSEVGRTTKHAVARETSTMIQADLVAAVHKVKQGPLGRYGQEAWGSYVGILSEPLMKQPRYHSEESLHTFLTRYHGRPSGIRAHRICWTGDDD